MTVPVDTCWLRSIRLCRCAGLLLTLVLVGCGLSDYEQKMQDTQAEVDRFDEENRLLDDFLKMPTEEVIEKDKEKTKDAERKKYTHIRDRIQLFIRPPKGISDKCKTKDQATFDGILYLYERASNELPKGPGNPKGPPGPAPGPVVPKAESNGVLDVFVAFHTSDPKDPPEKRRC